MEASCVLGFRRTILSTDPWPKTRLYFVPYPIHFLPKELQHSSSDQDLAGTSFFFPNFSSHIRAIGLAMKTVE